MANPTVDDDATISPENQDVCSIPDSIALFFTLGGRARLDTSPVTVEPANLGMMAICAVSSVEDRTDKGDAL